VQTTVQDTTPTQLYQGYQFMNRTGLRSGYYTPNQVDSATQEVMKKRKFADGGKIKKPVFLGKLDNRVVSDNTSVQRPIIQQQDVRLKTPQEVKKANRENFQKSIGVKPTYNVQDLIDFGTPRQVLTTENIHRAYGIGGGQNAEQMAQNHSDRASQLSEELLFC
jgi:hypothetical protein